MAGQASRLSGRRLRMGTGGTPVLPRCLRLSGSFFMLFASRWAKTKGPDLLGSDASGPSKKGERDKLCHIVTFYVLFCGADIVGGFGGEVGEGVLISGIHGMDRDQGSEVGGQRAEVGGEGNCELRIANCELWARSSRG
jgi:hypothetical protein